MSTSKTKGSAPLDGAGETANPERLSAKTSATVDLVGWAIPIPITFRGHGKLRKGLGVFNGMMERGELDLFPPDLPATKVRAHLATHLQAAEDDQSTGRGKKVTASQTQQDRKKARKLRRSIDKIIDGVYPSGHPARANFYPSGNGDWSELQLLDAQLSGIELHPLPRLPGGITLAELKQLAASLTAGEKAQADAERKKAGLVTTSSNLSLVTRTITKRLVSILHGVYGYTDPVLVQYGLTVRSAKAPTRKKGDKKKPVAQASQQSATATEQPAEDEKTTPATPTAAKATAAKAESASKAEAASAGGEASTSTGSSSAPGNVAPSKTPGAARVEAPAKEPAASATASSETLHPAVAESTTPRLSSQP